MLLYSTQKEYSIHITVFGPFWDGSVISDINAYGFITPTFRRPWLQHCYMLQLYNIKSIVSIISEFCPSLWSLYDNFHVKERGNDTKVKVRPLLWSNRWQVTLDVNTAWFLIALHYWWNQVGLEVEWKSNLNYSSQQKAAISQLVTPIWNWESGEGKCFFHYY